MPSEPYTYSDLFSQCIYYGLRIRNAKSCKDGFGSDGATAFVLPSNSRNCGFSVIKHKSEIQPSFQEEGRFSGI